MTDVRSGPFGEPRDRTPLSVQALARLSFLIALAGVAVFAPWPRLWLFLAIMMATFSVNLLVLRARNPALIKQRLVRARPESGFDRFVLVGGIFLGIAMFLVAGIDAVVLRDRPLPWSLWTVGLVLHLGGDFLVAWALSENPHARREIHVAEAHRVVDTGPYRWVRHPMYLGILPMLAGWPLLLGSPWALVPAVAMGALMVARTAFEDRVLRAELPGYDDYAQRTRYRLLPGLW